MSNPSDFPIGSRVLATHNPKHDREYSAAGQMARLANAGKPGTVNGRGAGHGLCFCVGHDGGGTAWWEPDELRPEPTAREKELLDILGIALVGLRTAVNRHDADDQVLLNVEAGLTAMVLNPDDMHAAALRLDNGDPV
jgi:hypothetical protein